MKLEQTLELIPAEKLLERVADARTRGARLVQIGATALPDKIEVTYSFDYDGRLETVRIELPAKGARVPSIGSIFPCSCLYENEIHDLFNIAVDGLAVDFHGNLYQTAVKYAFGDVKAPTAKPKPAPAPAPPRA